MEKIKYFSADMGGTEIYQPLDSIFKLTSQPNEKSYDSHIYLLTDGEVGDTQSIINLVKKNCGPIQKTYLHTFGVGNGAD